MEEKIVMSIEDCEELFRVYAICLDGPSSGASPDELEKARAELGEYQAKTGIVFPPYADYLRSSLQFCEQTMVLENGARNCPFSKENGGPNVAHVYDMAMESACI